MKLLQIYMDCKLIVFLDRGPSAHSVHSSDWSPQVAFFVADPAAAVGLVGAVSTPVVGLAGRPPRSSSSSLFLASRIWYTRARITHRDKLNRLIQKFRCDADAQSVRVGCCEQLSDEEVPHSLAATLHSR